METAVISVGLEGEVIGGALSAGVLAMVCVMVVGGFVGCGVLAIAIVEGVKVVGGWRAFEFRMSICWLV